MVQREIIPADKPLGITSVLSYSLGSTFSSVHLFSREHFLASWLMPSLISTAAPDTAGGDGSSSSKVSTPLLPKLEPTLTVFRSRNGFNCLGRRLRHSRLAAPRKVLECG